jgi:hypothetical protein
VNVELLRQLGQRLLALHSSQSHLRLEGRAVVPAYSLRHLISCSTAMLAAFRQKLQLAACPDLPSHLYQQLRHARRFMPERRNCGRPNQKQAGSLRDSCLPEREGPAVCARRVSSL